MAKTCDTTTISSSKAYMPAFLPKPPQRIIAYTEKTLCAPHSALRGVLVDGVEPEQPTARSRVRMYSVGSTNRWRSPKLLGGDFLGLSQAVKSVSTRKNNFVRNIKTDVDNHQNKRHSLHEDLKTLCSDHPATTVPKGVVIAMTATRLVYKRVAWTTTHHARLHTLNQCKKRFICCLENGSDVSDTANKIGYCLNGIGESPYLSVTRESDFLGSAWGRTSLVSRPFTTPSIDDAAAYDRDFNITRPMTSFSTQTRKIYGSSARTSRTRFKDPNQLFQMFSRLVCLKQEPDVRLHCMGKVWQLHRAYMTKSKALTTVLRKALSEDQPRVYNDGTSEKVDTFISQNDVYSNDYKEVSHRLTSKQGEDLRLKHKLKASLSHSVIDVKLPISDPWVTKHALAIALGHLYLEENIVSTGDAIETLAAACSLEFNQLSESCCQVMINNLSADTVCLYLQAAARYKQERVILACERWLELNFVSQLSCTIFIKDVPAETLDKILQSSRLFTFNEYSLYKALCIWLFMQLHPDIQFMPPLTTVMTYFSSMTRTCSFLEREEGIPFSTAFSCLRLHGITDTKHLQDVMYMNIIPQSWLLRVLSHHYHALQGGGDMSFLLNFSLGANRYGFILKHEPGYHSEIISLHGFHFEAKAQKHGFSDTYIVYLQRLRPTDPSLSIRACDRSTFSMRRDRVVRYQITVQHPTPGDDCQWRHSSTGILEQTFGLDHKTARSQVLKVADAQTPVYVSFSIFFPPS